MKKYWALILSLCLLAITIGATLFAASLPVKAAARNLAAINSLTVGKTTETELLTRPEFQALNRVCIAADCIYTMQTRNTLLERLRLAPPLQMSTAVMVRDGLLTGVSVFVRKTDLPPLSIAQVQKMPENCNESPCVVRIVAPSHRLMGVKIHLDNESPYRNRLPELVNTKCFSRLHGCTYDELMPLAKELNIKELNIQEAAK